jgi:hypothetical protein
MANDEQPNDEQPTEYPAQWGYANPPTAALGAAIDVYVSSLDDDEFNAMVSRTRQGGR